MELLLTIVAFFYVDGMTGNAARETFPEAPGMSHCGWFLSSPSLATYSECSARNGRKPLASGRLAFDNICLFSICMSVTTKNEK